MLKVLYHSLDATHSYHCQRNVKIDAYHTYVRPILEYAVTAWAPHTQRIINKIKTIQRQAARFVMSDFSTYSSVTTMLYLNCSGTHYIIEGTY